MLYLIGLGLENEDITAKAMKAMKQCSSLYLDSYTSLGADADELSRMLGKAVVPVKREFLEEKMDFILDEAKKKDVGVLVGGDCLSATTHVSLLLECRKRKITYQVVHGISILTAVGETGLNLYNFGKIASIPFERKNLKVPYEILKENLSKGMHTLFLLDLNPRERKFVSIVDAVDYLLKHGMEDRICVGCCKLGTPDAVIKAWKARQLLKENFKEFPQCLIVPGKMHFVEEEFLQGFR